MLRGNVADVRGVAQRLTAQHGGTLRRVYTAALVDSLSADAASVTLVNTNQLEPRTIVIQAGGYAEHRFISATLDGRTAAIDGP